MSISRKIAQFAINTKYKDIPENVLFYSRFALADYIAVSYAGANTADNAIIRKYAELDNNDGMASVFGSDKKYSAKYAALINGTTAHALDFDDVGLTAINHPTVSVAPAAIAIGEILNKSGEEVLTAFTIGVEVLQKVALMLMPSLTDKGWHTTCVFGTIGSTVAASILKGLSEDEIVNALGISCSLASGLRVNFGTYTKPFHAGLSAYNGIVASELASVGLNSSEFAFEGSDGFAQAFTGLQISDNDILLGEPWDAIEAGFQFKKYPVCSSSHTALDGFIDLVTEHNIDYKNIDKVIAGVSEFAFRNLLFNNPKTIQQAKFSMPYAIAVSAIKKDLTLDSFKDTSLLEDEHVTALMDKVEMKLDDAYADKGIMNNEPAIVYVTLADGSTLQKRVDYAIGTNPNPLSKERMQAKFNSCLHDIGSDTRTQLFESIFNIDTCKDIKDLLSIIPR